MRLLGPDVVSVVRPTGVLLLDFFYSRVQLYILFIPYLCLISFLYLDLYLQGNDTSVGQGSFMRAKHLFILILIRNKGEVGIIKLF